MKTVAARLRISLICCLVVASLACLPACSSQSSDSSANANSNAAQTNTNEDTADAAVNETPSTCTYTVSIDAAGDGSNVKTYVVTLNGEVATVLEALQATDAKVTVADSEYGAYVESIDDVATDASHGWVYTVDGHEVMESAGTCEVASGSSIEWSYISF